MEEYFVDFKCLSGIVTLNLLFGAFTLWSINFRRYIKYWKLLYNRYCKTIWSRGKFQLVTFSLCIKDCQRTLNIYWTWTMICSELVNYTNERRSFYGAVFLYSKAHFFILDSVILTWLAFVLWNIITPTQTCLLILSKWSC